MKQGSSTRRDDSSTRRSARSLVLLWLLLPTGLLLLLGAATHHRAARYSADVPCPSACAALAASATGPVICDVERYAFGWGNRICEGILPLCVLRPAGAEDVAAAVRTALKHELPLSVRSGGHSYTCNSVKPGSLHVDLRSLDAVTVHPAAGGRAGSELTTGAGSNMRQLLDALPAGLMIVHGQCPTVGAGGLFLHGGYHTSLSLKYGRGNDTVTAMEVVTANGTVLQLSDASPPAQQDLWRAMRQAGSSFAVATRITVKVIDDLPSRTPTDGGDFFALDVPRGTMLRLVERAHGGKGQLNYIHVNGVDFLIAAASTDWRENAAWLEGVIGRPLRPLERLRSRLVHFFEQPVSLRRGGSDSKFGKSGAVPYIFSSQEAFSDVSFILPLSCYLQPQMQELLAALPDERDPSTALGCYLQVTTTYGKGKAFIDYNCAYSSEWYRARQRELNAQVEALCPVGIERYVNTPSAFLSPRDYYPNYDELAAVKARWDPGEVIRVYQGVRPTGRAPDAFEFWPAYVRTWSLTDWLMEVAWSLMARLVLR